MAIPRDSSREGGRAEEKYLRGMQRSEGIIPRFSPLCLGAVQTSGPEASRQVASYPRKHYFRTKGKTKNPCSASRSTAPSRHPGCSGYALRWQRVIPCRRQSGKSDKSGKVMIRREGPCEPVNTGEWAQWEKKGDATKEERRDQKGKRDPDSPKTSCSGHLPEVRMKEDRYSPSTFFF